MINVDSLLPSIFEQDKDATPYQKELYRRLRELLADMAKDQNSKITTVHEDPAYWMLHDGGDNPTFPVGGGGGGAPVDATYVVMSANATLTQERVLTAGDGITITDGGANSTVTIAASATECQSCPIINYAYLGGV